MSLSNLSVRVSKCSIPNRKHMETETSSIICALTNNHNHLFSKEIKGTPVDELAEVRAERGSCEESSAVLLVEGFRKTSWVRLLTWHRQGFSTLSSFYHTFHWQWATGDAEVERQTLTRSHSRNGIGMCVLQMSIRLLCEKNIGHKLEPASRTRERWKWWLSIAG